MASPISKSIADLLVTASIGVFGATSGWGIFVSREPSGNNTVITIFDTGGPQANPKFLLDYPSIQVRVRGDKGEYVEAWQKLKDIKDSLLGTDPVVVNGDRIVAINQETDIIALGYDDNERPLLVVNFSLIVEPAASATTKREAL